MANLARSKCREEELNILVKEQQPDVAIITEAELHVHDTITIPDYVLFPASLSPCGKCRLFMLVKTGLAKKTVVLASSHTDVWLRLKLNNPLTVVGMYRQWSNTESADLASFYNRCATLLDGNRTIVSGDINLDFSRKADKSYARHAMASEHFATMEAFGLEYVGPYVPTFESYGSYKSTDGKYLKRTSILDHVYSLGNSDVDVSVVSVRATDHLPVRAVVPTVKLESSRKKWVTRRPLAKLSGPELCLAIDQAFKETPINLYACDDVDVVHDTIVSVITKALDMVAPHRMVPSDRPDRPPLFLAKDTLQAMKSRDAAATQCSPEYRALRNKVCRLLRRDRLKSSLNLINRSKNNPKKLWALTRSFIGANTNFDLPSSLVLEDGEVCSDQKAVADTLNSFFIEKITKIRNDIGATGSRAGGNVCDDETVNNNSGVFHFKYPSAEKVKAIIMSLKNTGALGMDEIPVSVLKLGAPVLSGPIAHLIRLSFGSSRVPSGFKLAIVKPIYKGKGKTKTAASSFRPVAILTALSKVLERCAFEILVDFLEPRLPPGQYGFRRGRSTTTAIADAHGHWSSSRAQGQILGVVAFDLQAAFDTLDATLLCTKLASMGIRGRANDWFKDYLSGRKQCVVVGGAKSAFMPIKHGVPQGSLLGPVLFLAMVADMPSKVGLVGNPSRGYVAYADDLCAWSSGDTVQSTKKDLEEIAGNVANFTANNYLSLSAEKTQVLWSGLPRCTDGPDVSIAGTLVKSSPLIELLGVKFDSNLNSTPFLAMQHRAAAPILATIRRLARYLPPAHLAKVASALLVGKVSHAAAVTITPRLSQSEPILPHVNKLQVSINDAARIILGSSRKDKIMIGDLLVKTGLPSLNQLVVKDIAIECWRAINMATSLGCLVCSGQKSYRPTRMTASNKLGLPFRFPRDSMIWHAVRIWNLCEDLRNATNMNSAKRAATRLAKTCPL